MFFSEVWMYAGSEGDLFQPIVVPTSHNGKIVNIPLRERGCIAIVVDLLRWQFVQSHFGRLLPDTILYSSKRHSIAPLNSGVRFDGDNRISFRIALSAVNR
jgi:hypothetical protein